jgi:hypothetical protein
MKLAIFAALAALMIAPTKAELSHRSISSLATTCDNDGHCNTDAHKNRRRSTAAATAKDARQYAAIDANGNTAGFVISHKTGARARVGIAYASRFQAYIDDLENNHGARVLFMNGIRPGRCLPESQHPCGKALDVCQLGRGHVDPRCNLPGRATLGQVAAAHGLFEGGRWCQSDYGHVQASVTAAACGDDPFRIVRRTTLAPVADEPRP